MRISTLRVATIHSICQIPGVVALAHITAKIVRLAWEENHHFDQLVTWAAQPQPPKLQLIVEYGLLLLFGAAIVLALFAIARRSSASLVVNARGWIILAVYEAVTILALPLNAALGFLLATALPLWIYARNRTVRSRTIEAAYLAFAVGALGIAFFILAATAWNPELRFLNDLSNLDEYTILGNGKTVQNAAFMREHSIPDSYKADCQIEKSTDLSFCLPASRRHFRNVEEALILFPPGEGVFYDWNAETLKVYRPLREDEKVLIRILWGDELPSNHFSQERQFTEEEAAFLRKNHFEEDLRSRSDSFFSRHADLYLPVLSRVTSQYSKQESNSSFGAGLSQTFAALLRSPGAPSFQRYYSIYWVAVYSYLVLIAFVTWWVSRNLWAPVFSFAAASCAILLGGHDVLRLAPDFNPIRHFPDLLCIAFIAYDLNKRTTTSALLRAAGIGVLIWWNCEFGVLMLAASCAWRLLEVASPGGKLAANLPRLILEIAVSFGVLVSTNSLSLEYSRIARPLGLSFPTASWGIVLGWILIITVMVWLRFSRATFLTPGARSYLLDVAGIGATYSALATVFPGWDPLVRPEVVMWPFAAVCAALLHVWMLDNAALLKNSASRLLSYEVGVLGIVLAATVADSLLAERDFSRQFENHTTFIWQFPGFSAASTASPSNAQEAIALVEQYQPIGHPIIVSRLSALFQILMQRLSFPPYVDLSSQLTSQDSLNDVVADIVRAQAPVIFVDRDLLEEPEGQALGESASYRLGSLGALAKLYRTIQACYEPGESRGALQVWHRTCDSR